MVDFYPLVGPILRRIDPETAHSLAIMALKLGLVPSSRKRDNPILENEIWGLRFANPIGLAAGFDKNAEVADAMLDQGYGHVEIGSVTPRPQAGNSKPRLFRLPADRAIINRMGFNNDGADAVAERLSKRRRRQSGWLGVNLGKNKETEEALDDYRIGIEKLAPLADYVVVNVSSPNTPGLRALQGREPLARLLSGVRGALDGLSLDPRPPLLLKVAPDLTDEDKRDIAGVVIAEAIDGLIATNTTIERPQSLIDGRKSESGGLSGAPLYEPSTRVLADFYTMTDGRVPLIGVGGVSDGVGAYRKIRAGASLVQIYSALVYEGPALVTRIIKELAALLEKDGFASVADAVGADHR